MSALELLIAIASGWLIPMLYIFDRIDIVSIRKRGKLLLLGLCFAVTLAAVITMLFDLPGILLAALTAVLTQCVTYVLLEKLFVVLKHRPPLPVYGHKSEVIELADRAFGFSFLVLSIVVGCAAIILLA